MMEINFFNDYLPRFLCNLCNPKKSSDIPSFDEKSLLRGAKKVTQVTWILRCIPFPSLANVTRMNEWNKLILDQKGTAFDSTYIFNLIKCQYCILSEKDTGLKSTANIAHRIGGDNLDERSC